MRRREKTSGPYTVGGLSRSFPSEGMAINVAQLRAEREENETWQTAVFKNGTKIARIERNRDGSVTTTPIGVR